MSNRPTVEAVLPNALLGMTAVTGIVDAVSLLSLGRVFTANMTGNIVFLGFASVGVPDVSVSRSLAALLAFLVGAVLGGRIMARAGADSQIGVVLSVFAGEIVLLGAAAVMGIGYSAPAPPHAYPLFAMIALTALPMGMRNAAVRKLGVPDLTTTVLTLTITGIAADSSLGHGSNPGWQRRAMSIVAMFAGAALGATVVRYSLAMALACAVAGSSLCSLALHLSLRTSSPVDPTSA